MVLDGIEELEDLRSCLRSVFSQELTDQLLDGQTSVETEQLEETVYSVNVLVDLLGKDGETVVGLESWSFPYVFEDDRWVFTDFRLVD